VDHLQRWSWILRSEETETDLSIWLPTEISGIFSIMHGKHPLWLDPITCYCDNWEHQGGVLSDQAICRVELCRKLSKLFLKQFRNSIYSNVYLKVNQVFLEAIYRVVVMLLPSYPLDIWKASHVSSSSTKSTVDVWRRRAAQSHSVVRGTSGGSKHRNTGKKINEHRITARKVNETPSPQHVLSAPWFVRLHVK